MHIWNKITYLHLAKDYALKSLKIAKKEHSVQNNETAWGALARYYDKAGLKDSALIYYKKLYESVGEGWYSNKVQAVGWLYHYYLEGNDKNNALKFGEEYISGVEKLNQLGASSQVIKINLAEKLRQDKKEQQLLKDKEERTHTLQLILIAIGILSCLIFYLILSRNFIVSQKTIEILGIIVMLIVFEFINLLLHGVIENFTHHSPLLMLLVLVALASVIVPIHHRLEKWTTKKLIKKNREIRLQKENKKMDMLKP